IGGRASPAVGRISVLDNSLVLCSCALPLHDRQVAFVVLVLDGIAQWLNDSCDVLSGVAEKGFADLSTVCRERSTDDAIEDVILDPLAHGRGLENHLVFDRVELVVFKG